MYIYLKRETDRGGEKEVRTHTYIREQTGMKREKRTLLRLQRMSLVRSTKVYKVNRREKRKERDVMKISIEVRLPLCRDIHLYIYIYIYIYIDEKKGTERMLES